MKQGRDSQLEKDANAWLSKGVKKVKRTPQWDAEKMMFESGLIGADELKHFDPTDDWNTRSSAYTLVSEDIDAIEPTLGTVTDLDDDMELPNVDDGLTRSRNRNREERIPLLRHVDLESEQDWPSPATKAAPTVWSVAAVPLGQLDNGQRKTCTSCGLSKGVAFFSPDPRNADGLHSSCKTCRRKNARESYVRKTGTNGQ